MLSVNKDVQDVAGLLPQHYTEMKLAKGKYTLGNRCYAGWPTGWRHDEVDVKVENGTQFYMLSLSFLNSCEIEKISAKEGRQLLQNSKKVELGKVAYCRTGKTKDYCWPDY